MISYRHAVNNRSRTYVAAYRASDVRFTRKHAFVIAPDFSRSRALVTWVRDAWRADLIATCSQAIRVIPLDQDLWASYAKHAECGGFRGVPADYYRRTRYVADLAGREQVRHNSLAKYESIHRRYYTQYVLNTTRAPRWLSLALWSYSSSPDCALRQASCYDEALPLLLLALLRVAIFFFGVHAHAS